MKRRHVSSESAGERNNGDGRDGSGAVLLERSISREVAGGEAVPEAEGTLGTEACVALEVLFLEDKRHGPRGWRGP